MRGKIPSPTYKPVGNEDVPCGMKKALLTGTEWVEEGYFQNRDSNQPQRLHPESTVVTTAPRLLRKWMGFLPSFALQ